MKKRNLLLILSVCALASCASITPSSPSTFEEGIVENQQQKQDIKALYNDSLDTTEELEDFTEGGSGEQGGEIIEIPPEEPVVPGESTQTSEEVLPSEPDSPVEQPEEQKTITSYHVDYTVDFALKASVGEHEIINSSEKQTYSLTYVKEGEDVFMELDLTHYYTEMTWLGEVSGSQTINVIFQDERLYLTQKVENSLGLVFEDKTSHDIKRKHIHREYKDYFLLMSINAMLDPTSRENNNSLVEQLLTNESVEVIDVTENTVTVKFDYESGVATMVFNTDLKAFTSVTFDKSKQQDILEIDDGEFEIDDDKIPEMPEIDGEEFEDDDLFPELDDDDHEHGHGHKDYQINVDLYRYLINMNFSYNDQVADKLTAEEIASYKHRGKSYEHYNDYHGYDDDHNHGYHGGRDEHHGQNDRPYHGGK